MFQQEGLGVTLTPFTTIYLIYLGRLFNSSKTRSAEMAGPIRQEIDIPALEKYISNNVPHISTPIDVKQVCLPISLAPVYAHN